MSSFAIKTVGGLAIIGAALFVTAAGMGLASCFTSPDFMPIAQKLLISSVVTLSVAGLGAGAICFHAKWIRDKPNGLAEATDAAFHNYFTDKNS